MANDTGLAADEHTIREHRFKTEDGVYNLYVQEWGNPGGATVLFLHGGPGGGCSDGHKKLFNPKIHRVIFLDQRGSGNSQPYGSLKENNTQKLVQDLELVRNKLAIKKWLLYGRSWGSTLALCYAINYPDRVSQIIIGGVFLGSVEESDWLHRAKFRMFFPEVDEQKASDPYSYLKLVAPTLRIDDRYTVPDKADMDEAPLKIELFYTKNRFFLTENYILKNAKRINVPVDIVQGRYDMTTPPKSAYQLHKSLPDSRIHWTIAGHSGSDRANYDVTTALLSQIR